MRLAVSVFLAMSLGLSASAQDLGGWEIIYASDDEMLLLIAAAEYRGDFRPLVHLHCKAGEARVFFRPYAESVRLQFDEGPMFLGVFTGETYGFAIDSKGRLVEETQRSGHIPMRHFAKSAELIARMLEHERLYVRVQGNTRRNALDRNHFELAGLRVIFQELGNPCASVDDAEAPPSGQSERSAASGSRRDARRAGR